jgi:two-component system chemotaxis response regulator CheB
MENGHRPAVDPLFRSAVKLAGPRAIAVVLSGSRDDGTHGAAAVAQHGGLVFAQEPEDALYASMPASVIEHVGAEVAPAAKLGADVAIAARKLVAQPPVDPAADDTVVSMETSMANLEDLTTGDIPDAHPSGLACPTCHGGLFEVSGGPTPSYRCWVGHAWSPQSLLDEQAVAFEGALWMALRSLEEKAELARRMSHSAGQSGREAARTHYETVGAEAEEAGRLIRELIRHLDTFDITSEPSGPA